MTNSMSAYPKPRVLAVVTGLSGILLLYLGVLLILAGGSLYYMVAGITLLVCCVLRFRGDHRGSQLYGTFLPTIWLIGANGRKNCDLVILFATSFSFL
ncbi:MAG TPA: hypothetical protein DCM64_05705 [Gammaproteobacteria bacterium]|jgi:glucose dehydrogenase|nr:hypothetical protein [Gammaproteobacteria bacterium]HAJ75931.1 hypothetical protein [Gammaproteobacteria bacterium]